MIGSPETESFDLTGFDASFFAAYAEQLSDINVDEQAAAALSDVMKIEKDDGSRKTLQELRDESRAFFAGEWVQETDERMNRLALQFAQTCMSHMHGSELARDSQLGSVFGKGVESLYGGEQAHRHSSRADDDDEDEKNKKKRRRFGS